MSNRWRVPFRATAVMLFFGCLAANATVIDFSTILQLGNLTQSVSTSGVTIAGFDVSKTTGVWSSGVILNNRAQNPDDRGLGVCSSPSNCPAINSGDINEIDNNGSVFEVIRLDFGGAVKVNSLGLASLDGDDNYAIFGSNTAQPNLALLTALSKGANPSSSGGNFSARVNGTFRYFFAAPRDRGSYDTGSNYLLNSVDFTSDVHTSGVPEPQTITLMGLGLVGLGILRRKLTR